jgi:hypothetical protein
MAIQLTVLLVKLKIGPAVCEHTSMSGSPSNACRKFCYVLSTDLAYSSNPFFPALAIAAQFAAINEPGLAPAIEVVA